MIVTEFSRHTQGFLVKDVDRIIRVDWDKVKPPESMLAGQDGMITAITELDDGRLVSILDVERILVEVLGEKAMPSAAADRLRADTTVFFADDSAWRARRSSRCSTNWVSNTPRRTTAWRRWERLKAMAARAGEERQAVDATPSS
jgi:two-component system chemotaxis response regulator CheV